jgi:PadR family transcriptional regulator, regulatory protein PadR
MSQSELRITTQVLKVLGVLTSNPTREISGADIARATGLLSGTLYPILMRLEQAKWVDSEWENGDPHKLGRPRRRLYSITAFGSKSAHAAFEEVRSSIGRPAWAIS